MNPDLLAFSGERSLEEADTGSGQMLLVSLDPVAIEGTGIMATTETWWETMFRHPRNRAWTSVTCRLMMRDEYL
ncbi:MAG: hypothetical protein MK102_07935 [Fuerstiella sp.]|nr:hypothetical protein [Fuerstiella sp.]